MAHKKVYKKSNNYSRNVEFESSQEKGDSLSFYNRLRTSLKQNYIFWVIVIAVLGASIYIQTAKYNYTQDDIIYSTENAATKKGIHGVPDVFTHGSLNYYTIEPTNSGVYRPVTLLTFCIEFELFKTFSPRIGHLINVFLYFLVLCLTGVILVRLFSIKKLPLLLPLLVLLLYALHPIHTEVVASIKSRETLLSAFFVFGALYLWLISIDKQGYIFKICIGVIFLLALMSKEEGLTFIAVVFLVSYVFFKMSILRSLKETAPFLLAATVYLILRSLALDNSIQTYNSVLNNVIYSQDGSERLATNLYIYLYYIKLLIYPFPLSMDYSFSQITPKTFANGWVMVSFFFFLCLIIAAFKGLSKRTMIGFAILYYLSTFSIFSNFTESITIGATVGERFMFLPSLGFCIILVYGLYLLAKKISSNKVVPIILAVFIPVSLVYSIKSFSRTKVWSDNITLYKSGLKTAPNSWRVHNNMAEASFAMALRMSSKDSVSNLKADSIQYWYQLAKKEFELAFEIIKGQSSMPYLNYMRYGDVLLKLKDTSGAKNAYQKVAALSVNPSSAWSNLGTISFYQADFANAIHYYQKALQANSPDFFSLYKNLGSSYLMMKDYQSSIQNYEKALQYGRDKEITSNLSFLYSSVGNIEKAGEVEVNGGAISNEDLKYRNLINAGKGAFNRADYRDAINYFKQCQEFYQKNGGIARFPDYLNLWAQSYLRLNEINDAKIIFNKVLEEDQKNFNALQNLGLIAYQREKKYPQATEYFIKCLNSNSPDFYFTYTSLGFLYWIQNMPDKAIESFENALKYGSSKTIINSLYQLWKLKGNQGKMNYYQDLLNKP